MATVNAHIEAPCDGCAHQPVCSRISALARLNEAFAVEHGSLPRGLAMALSASVECDAYLRAKGTGRAGPRSPAQKAVMEKMRAAKANRPTVTAEPIEQRVPGDG